MSCMTENCRKQVVTVAEMAGETAPSRRHVKVYLINAMQFTEASSEFRSNALLQTHVISLKQVHMVLINL